MPHGRWLKRLTRLVKKLCFVTAPLGHTSRNQWSRGRPNTQKYLRLPCTGLAHAPVSFIEVLVAYVLPSPPWLPPTFMTPGYLSHNSDIEAAQLDPARPLSKKRAAGLEAAVVLLPSSAIPEIKPYLRTHPLSDRHAVRKSLYKGQSYEERSV